jgi:hypothetical protein
MAPRLAQAQPEGAAGQTSRPATRREAAALHRDVNHAQFRVERLHQGFPSIATAPL